MPVDPGSALVGLGKLSKPADTLIKKVSNAVGVLFEPRQIKRVAKAKAEVARIEAQSEIEITELHRRAVRRWIEEEAQRQRNMEAVTAKALPLLTNGSKPDSVEDDWLVNFFDKSRIVSDDEMQQLWSRVLAGEANTPGSYSKRTVNLLSDLDRADAVLLGKLCGFAWVVGSNPTRDLVPLVFESGNEIYARHGVDFTGLEHLDSIGLIQFGKMMSLSAVVPQRFSVTYYGRRLTLKMPKRVGNELTIGVATFTRSGQELARIAGGRPVEGLWEYVQNQWKEYL